MEVEVTVALVAAILAMLIVHLYRHFTQLRRNGIPGPTPWPLVGNLLQMFYRGVNKTDEEWFQKYGKVYGCYFGYQPQVVTCDPELIKNVLVKDFHNFTDRPVPKNIPRLLSEGLFFMQGRNWKRVRNLLTPSFSAAKLKQFLPIIDKCASVLATNIGSQIRKEVDVRKIFSHFTMDAIASTAFGIDIDSQNQPEDPFVTHIERLFIPSSFTRIYVVLTSSIPILGDALKYLGFSSSPGKTIDFYQRTGQTLIDERKKHKMERVDFIQLLLKAEFDPAKSEYIQNGVDIGPSDLSEDIQQKEKLTDFEINATAFVFFLAGFETTASLLRYSTYVLALHPDIEAKLLREIEENIQEESPTYQNLATLKYMDQFFNEVLRMYPPITRLSRTCQTDIRYGDMVIPRGTSVVVPVWTVHYDPENYPDSEVFDPERFSTEGGKTSGGADGMTFLPWGVGPRHCIGMRLAQVEAKIALVHILRKFRFERTEKTVVPLELLHVGVLRPKTPILLRVAAR
ncbi:cytochrome P450 3A41-like [Dreissena polymorpha]|uniref:Cytochrome P450 n=1 Tax=Dreissena polymorpha TaxID=45954 RepID=A0A9D4MAP6_DREPO|nr:cytochrome P450 3A41-like [Dreissena polymorpha]KAH3871556.1 hypothetical protein DPMN_034760 [Dreissena polymorpha]